MDQWDDFIEHQIMNYGERFARQFSCLSIDDFRIRYAEALEKTQVKDVSKKRKRKYPDSHMDQYHEAIKYYLKKDYNFTNIAKKLKIKYYPMIYYIKNNPELKEIAYGTK